MFELKIGDLTFATRSEAARNFCINPKLVTERMTKRGWTLDQALELEPSPSRVYAKKVVIDGTEYPSMRQAAKALSVAQSTLMNRNLDPERSLAFYFRSGSSID